MKALALEHLSMKSCLEDTEELRRCLCSLSHTSCWQPFLYVSTKTISSLVSSTEEDFLRTVTSLVFPNGSRKMHGIPVKNVLHS
jgi:hypothetical protein